MHKYHFYGLKLCIIVISTFQSIINGYGTPCIFFVSFQLLERCANPSGSKEDIRLEASPELRTELYKALREVMDIARQVDTDETDLRHLDRDM